MRRAFGKPIGLAARVTDGDTIIEVRTYKEYLDKVKEALRVASAKLPIKVDLSIFPLEGNGDAPK